MTFIVASQSTSNTVTTSTQKRKMIPLTLSVNSLMPNSKYSFWYSGVDLSWCCKQSGKRLGDTMVSDETGTLSFTFFGEMSNDSIVAQDDQPVIKKHSFQLKDISGAVVAVFNINQTLNVRN